MASKSTSRLIRRIIYVLVALVIIAFIISRMVGGQKGPEYTTAKVQTGDIQQTVELTGTTEPKNRYTLQFTKSGIIGSLPVTVGAVVKQGDVLAALKNDDVQFQLDAQKAGLHIAQANLAKAVAGKPSQQVQEGKLQVDLAKSSLNLANTSKQNFLASQQAAVNSAYIAQLSAKTALDQAQSQYNYTLDQVQTTTWDHPSTPIYDSGYYYGDLRAQQPQATTSTTGSMTGTSSASSSSFASSASVNPNGNYVTNVNNIDNAQFTVQKAQEAYDSAQEAYNKAVADLKNQSDQLDNGVDKANIGLLTAQQEYNLTVAKPRDVDIAPLNAQVDQAWAGVNLAQYQLDQTQLKAPVDGVVTNVAQNVGETTSLAQPLITLDSQYLDIKALVSEADIAKIQVGQNVDLTFDAFGGDKSFKGNVYEVDPSETIVQGVVYYVVKVQFMANDTDVKPGMTANLTIQTNTKTGVVEVPAKAVQYDGNQAYVQVLTTDTNGKQTVQNQNVEIGLQGDENYEVTSGLKGGEDVVTFTKS